jgi:hypothetical protein
MPANHLHLLAATLVLVLLTFAVAVAMFFARFGEMRRKRLHPQAVATSAAMAARLEHTAPADNFRNLFEVPVLFYALVAAALAVGVVPPWLVVGAWAFVALRVLHSLVHCSYNRVLHRAVVFLAGYLLVLGLWTAFVASVFERASA